MADDRTQIIEPFADVLRRARRSAGLTQEELAERANLSVRGLSDLERGVNRTPRRETIQALLKVLQLSPDDEHVFRAAARPPASAAASPTRSPTSASGQTRTFGEIHTSQETRPEWERSTTEVASPAGDRPFERSSMLGPPQDAALLLPPPDHFVGRQADLSWVRQRLCTGGTWAITALGGMGGIGKTTLASMAIHQLLQERQDHQRQQDQPNHQQQQECFPDGIAVVFCQHLVDGAEVLRRLLSRFDPARRVPEVSDLGRLADLAQARLQGKSALVVLDNVEPALPSTPVLAPLQAAGLSVLVTARHRLPRAAVPAEASRQLDLLDPNEALELFRLARGGESGGVPSPLFLTPKERTAAQTIVEMLGRHTLAVKLVGAYAGSEQRDLEALAAELADPTRVLALPGEDETPEAVRRSFSLSLDSLPEGARQLFVGLGAVATPESGRQAVLALGAGLGQAHPEESLHLLLVRALVEPYLRVDLPLESDRERLRLHPLVRALSTDLFGEWSAAEQECARLAVAAHLAAYAEIHQTRNGVLAADEGNFTGALEWAHREAQGQQELVATLAHGLRYFWRDRGRYWAGVRYLAWGIAVEAQLATLPSILPPPSTSGEKHPGPTPSASWSNSAGDAATGVAGQPAEWRKRLVDLRLIYGFFRIVVGQSEEAVAAAQQSLEAFRALQDRHGEAEALLVLGVALLYRSQLHRAYDSCQQALAISRELGDRRLEMEALKDMGTNRLFCGEPLAAAGPCQQALAISRELGDSENEADILSGLAWTARLHGQLAAAEDGAQQYLAFSQQIASPISESIAWGLVGEVALLRGQLGEAEADFQRGLALNPETGDRSQESFYLFCLGRVALRAGELARAEGYLLESLRLAHQISASLLVGHVQSLRGAVALQRGEAETAATLLQESLAILRESGDQLGEAETSRWLGQVAEALGDLGGAEEAYRSSLAVASAQELGPQIAAAQLALGQLLAEHLDRGAEGCSLLLEALQRFTQMGMPEADTAREVATGLSCHLAQC